MQRSYQARSVRRVYARDGREGKRLWSYDSRLSCEVQSTRTCDVALIGGASLLSIILLTVGTSPRYFAVGR